MAYVASGESKIKYILFQIINLYLIMFLMFTFISRWIHCQQSTFLPKGFVVLSRNVEFHHFLVICLTSLSIQKIITCPFSFKTLFGENVNSSGSKYTRDYRGGGGGGNGPGGGPGPRG